MKILKFITYSIICLLFIGLVIGLSDRLTSFEGETNPFNVTLEGGVNNTQYIVVPRYVYMDNMTITIRGIRSS